MKKQKPKLKVRYKFVPNPEKPKTEKKDNTGIDNYFDNKEIAENGKLD
jgi:hypothetical protein